MKKTINSTMACILAVILALSFISTIPTSANFDTHNVVIENGYYDIEEKSVCIDNPIS